MPGLILDDYSATCAMTIFKGPPGHRFQHPPDFAGAKGRTAKRGGVYAQGIFLRHTSVAADF